MRYIFFDTETTGIKPDKDRIIEIAAYDPEKNKEFVSLVNPEMPIPAEASAVHNITDDMVKDAPNFKHVALDFVDFCEGDVILVAHNNDAFDKPFIENEFERSGVPLPKRWKYLDSLKWSRKYRPDLPRHGLQHLRELHGIAANNAHRALDDVIILHRVFMDMIDDLSPQTVYKLMNEKQILRTMPFGKHKGEPLSEVPKSYASWLLKNGALDKPENLDLKQSLQKLGIIS